MKIRGRANNSTEFLQGSKEHIDELNKQFAYDVLRYRTRPYLNRYERRRTQEYHARPNRNRLIAHFPLTSSGQFLPQAYTAPKDIQDMLYPIGDIVEYDRLGTLVIDREQYHPNLKNLSYFIYMVDEELYEHYRHSQNFLGDNIPTYMFDRHAANGIRVFRDYHDLAVHLRNRRSITYCFGPRTTFYMRYYLHSVETMTIDDAYAYGEISETQPVQMLLDILDKHMAFNIERKRETVNIELSIDNYSRFRQLADKFRTNLPNITEKSNKIMIQRFSKQTMHSRTIMKLTVNGSKNAHVQSLGIRPYHHLLIHDDKLIAYLWDTRRIQAVVPIDAIEQKHLTYNVIDNMSDLVLLADTPKEIHDYIMSERANMPVQIRESRDILENVPGELDY